MAWVVDDCLDCQFDTICETGRRRYPVNKNTIGPQVVHRRDDAVGFLKGRIQRIITTSCNIHGKIREYVP